MKADSITIPADAYLPRIVSFVAESALSYCTTVDTDLTGFTHVTASWPVAAFSRGEQALWGVLESLCAGDLRLVLDRCDVANVAALRTVIDSLAVA